jgi:hypothetical protein
MRRLEDYKIGMGMQFGYFPRPGQNNALPSGANPGEKMPSMEEIEAMLKASNPTQDSMVK